MAKTDVSDFYELRTALVTMQGVAQDALDFFDRQGIAARKGKPRVSSNGHAPTQEPDGKHITAEEAAKILKVSDSAVRLWAKKGQLPLPTNERRDTRKGHIHVWLRDDIVAFGKARNAVK
jgi:hypothetical protein